MAFSADETTDIGDDFGMPVSTDYGAKSRCNARIELVQIGIGDDNHDHLIDPDDIIRVAMSRQKVGCIAGNGDWSTTEDKGGALGA